jgi:flagellin
MQFDRLSDGLSLAFGRIQTALADATAKLSSGLRINSAADDPSGLAIAETLHSQALSLDQGQRNVQDGTNALTVADGALETVQQVLQRMRSLVVGGRSDLMSDSQRQDVNAEIGQLGREIDTIAGNTQFNGLKLLDGSLSSGTGTFGTGVVPQNDVLASGLPLVDPASLVVNTTQSPLDLKISITAYDPATNLVTYTVDAASSDPAQTFQTAYPESQQMLSGENYDNFWNTFPGPLPPNVDQHQINDGAGNGLVQFTFNNVTAADVGKSTFIYTVPPLASSTGRPLEINTGPSEGNTVSVSSPGVSQNQLGIAGVRVASDDTITEGSEYRLDAAIVTVSGERAVMGAQIVALGESGNAASVQQVATTASESAIRDLNVAQEMTQYTKLQIQSTMETHMLHSVQGVTTMVYQLLTAGL